MFLIKVQVFPQNLGEYVSYPGKKYTDPDRHEKKKKKKKIPDPKVFLKTLPDPEPASVWFGLVRRNSGFQVAPQVFILN